MHCMKELGRVTFSPDTASGGGSPGLSEGSPQGREKNLFNFLYDDLEGKEVRKIKHAYIINKHV